MANPEDFAQAKAGPAGEDNDTDGLSGKASKVAADVREGISSFAKGMKDKISDDPVRKVSEAASQVRDQVRDYIGDRGIAGLGDDVTNVIRRYPIPALLCGVLVGVLLARPRGDS